MAQKQNLSPWSQADPNSGMFADSESVCRAGRVFIPSFWANTVDSCTIKCSLSVSTQFSNSCCKRHHFCVKRLIFGIYWQDFPWKRCDLTGACVSLKVLFNFQHWLCLSTCAGSLFQMHWLLLQLFLFSGTYFSELCSQLFWKWRCSFPAAFYFPRSALTWQVFHHRQWKLHSYFAFWKWIYNGRLWRNVKVL